MRRDSGGGVRRKLSPRTPCGSSRARHHSSRGINFQTSCTPEPLEPVRTKPWNPGTLEPSNLEGMLHSGAMSFAVTVDEDRRLIHVVVTGTWPTLPEIAAERSRLIMAGMIRDGVVELVDVRGVTKGIPNLSQMQAILHAIGTPPLKRAIVVGSNVQFSAGRMAELLDPKHLKVFRDEDSALKWLFDEEPTEEPPQVDKTPSGRIRVFKHR